MKPKTTSLEIRNDVTLDRGTAMTKLSRPDRPIIFFDGVCKLCNGAARFIMAHDRRRQFEFLPMQSVFGQQKLAELGIEDMEAATLYEGGRVYQGSDAILRIVRHLDGIYRLLYALILIPRPIREWIYRKISQKRYQWFGETDQCLLPSRVTSREYSDYPNTS